MPVITSCKDGEYLIGEIQIVLPPSLELDIEAVEMALICYPKATYDVKLPLILTQ